MTSTIHRTVTIIHKNIHNFGSKLDIQSLDQFIVNRKTSDPKHMFESGSLDIFQFGCHPLRLRN